MSNGLRNVFAAIWPRYELTNHVLTLGLDMVARRLVARAAGQAQPGRWLDLCSGTGETAALLARRAPIGTLVYAADFCLPMLACARRKRVRSSLLLTVADASQLPYPDGSFQLVTITFATRNLASSPAGLRTCLCEIRRVLAPGGLLAHLETSQPPHPVIRGLFHAYVACVVKPVGARLTGNMPGYAYLASSIPRFPGAEELARAMTEAGFSSVSFRHLLLGVGALHVAKNQGQSPHSCPAREPHNGGSHSQ